MLALSPKALLEEAAHPSFDRIKKDLAKAPERLRPMLAHIQENLFDPSLTVLNIQKICNIRDRSISTHFCSAVGSTIWVYIGERRLETAAYLLKRQTLKIWEISELIGYSSLPVFSRAFCRWSGQQPLAFRRESWKGRTKTRPRAKGFDDSDRLRQAVDGILAPDQANVLIDRLCEIYSQRQLPHHKLPVDSEAFEPIHALEILRAIRGCTWEEQRVLVREKHQFRSAALYDLLRQKSQKEGRKNRQRGVEFAELALEALESCGPGSGTGGHALRAQAWAWIGNARRLAHDFPGSERAFTQAREDWNAHVGGSHSLIEAEICNLEAGLKFFQRRHAEAEALANHAIPIMRRSGAKRLLVQALTMRASIATGTGKASAAIPDLREALPIAEELGDTYLAMAVCSFLALALIDHNLDEAEAVVAQAWRYPRRADNPFLKHQLKWIEGLVRMGREDWQAAESRLQEARAGFNRIGDWGQTAVVSLDLAILLARLGRHSEVIELTTDIVPLLEAHSIRREAVAALKLMQEALNKKSVSLAVLDQLRGNLQKSLLRGIQATDWA